MRFLAITLCALFFSLTAFSQEIPKVELKVVKDSSGTVFWPLSLPMYLQISDVPNDQSGIALSNSAKAQGPAMHWENPGIHYIRQTGDIIPRRSDKGIAFPIHVDGTEPETDISFGGSLLYTADKIYYGTGLISRFNAKDDMSGIATTYLSINGSKYLPTGSIQRYLDEKEYRVQYMTVDKVGNMEAPKTATFTVDLTSPVTSFQIQNDHVSQKILSPRTNIALSAFDNMSGVKSTKYSFDNGSSSEGDLIPLANLKDGEHVLHFESSDQVNNNETAQDYAFYLDATAPEASSEIIGSIHKNIDKVYVGPTSRIQITASDNKAGVKNIIYTINEGPEQIYDRPFTLSNQPGEFRITYRSTDNVNNESVFTSDALLQSMFVDGTPPTILYQVSNAKVTTRDTLFVIDNPSFSLSSRDAESGVANISYQLDNGSIIDYTEPIIVNGEGAHTIKYSSMDNVKNSAESDIVFVIDNIAPEISWEMNTIEIGSQKLLTRDEALPIYAKGSDLRAMARDEGVGVEAIYYSVNGSAEQRMEGSIKMDTQGIYRIVIRAIDLLGNEAVLSKVEFVIQ